MLRVRDWNGSDEIRVSRATKDDRVRGVIRGLKNRATKVVPVEFPVMDWLEEHVSPERRLQDPMGRSS